MKTELRVDPSAECKRRVLSIKSKLPKNIRQLIRAKHPEYDSVTGSQLINNVISGVSPDLKLTEILESFI